MTVKIIIDGSIYSWSAEDYVNQIIAAKDEDIEVEISSPGGSVTAGLMVYNKLKNHTGNVTVRMMGLVASMASVIAMAGNKIIAEDASIFMIHNASTSEYGDHNVFNKTANVLDGISGMLAKVYASKTSLDVTDIRKMMDKETYLFGSEIVDKGFASEVIETDSADAKDDLIALARVAVSECMNDVSAKDDSHKIEAMSKLVISQKPPTKVREKMSLKKFLAENPAERAEFDNAMSETQEASNKKHEKLIAKVTPILSSKEYPEVIKALALKVLKGESEPAALEGAVAVIDAQMEMKNSADAKDDRTPDTPAGNIDADKPSEDGSINNEADFEAAVKRVV